MEAIWHADFFDADGLTILYREDSVYLDQAMPLNIYTDMYHYLTLLVYIRQGSLRFHERFWHVILSDLFPPGGIAP